MKQIEYLKFVANKNYDKFFQQGYATAGHNGPHGHKDSEVRNTAHYLIIYGFLYKITKEKRYLDICDVFFEYLYNKQQESESGAIECMLTDKFDHLNGLIGQGWVIEALLYYYEITKSKKALNSAYMIFYSQKYDWAEHLWSRIELDGTNIGYDPTYNHQVWFAACSYKLAEYCNDSEIDRMIKDFITEGSKRDFVIYDNGLLHHHIKISIPFFSKRNLKSLIKKLLSPVSFLSPQKLNPKYMEYAYHIFDMYGFAILSERYGTLPLFMSEKYKKAVSYAMNLSEMNKNCGVIEYLKKSKPFNIYSYSYNSPAFEYPYLAMMCGMYNKNVASELYEIQEKLMYNPNNMMMDRNQPDLETWNARMYEIIRFYELKYNLK